MEKGGLDWTFDPLFLSSPSEFGSERVFTLLISTQMLYKNYAEYLDLKGGVHLV